MTPNIGLFWYFFTEMFDHFHLFFTYVFQLNPFIYVIPLALRFDDNVPLLSFTLCTIIAIFKSYPSIGDVGFYLALLPLWNHLVPCKLSTIVYIFTTSFLFFSFQTFLYRRLHFPGDFGPQPHLVVFVDLHRLCQCQFLLRHNIGFRYGSGKYNQIVHANKIVKTTCIDFSSDGRAVRSSQIRLPPETRDRFENQRQRRNASLGMMANRVLYSRFSFANKNLHQKK